MTRRSRLKRLEGQNLQPEPLRVVITRSIVEGGAKQDGEGLKVVQVIRREFDLYPDGVGGWSK